MKVNFDSQSFLNIFYDPVTLEPMESAVTLVPCAHKVEKATAEIFLQTPEKVCSICRQAIASYVVDHTFQDVINRVFSLPQSERIVEVFPEKELIADMSFPGRRASFKYEDGQWAEGDQNVCRYYPRHLCFWDREKENLFYRFQLSGHADGSVSLHVDYHSEQAFGPYTNQEDGFWARTETLYLYLKHYKLFECDNSGLSYIEASTIEQVRCLFRLLRMHHTIPDEYITKMQAIVNAGKWQ